MNSKQKQLAEYMSGKSEEAYYAGWMKGLEYALWEAVLEGPKNYGRLQIQEEHIHELKKLSDACDGWVYFDDSTEETFIPLAEWQKKYELDLPKMKRYIR